MACHHCCENSILNISVHIVFVLLMFGLSQRSMCNAEEDFVRSLKIDLLGSYDAHTYPTSENATLRMQLFPEHFKVNEDTSTFYLKLHIYMGWRDDRLKWDPHRYGLLTQLTFSARELWVPEITIYNDAPVSSIDRLHPAPVKVFWPGDVWWYAPAEFNSSCVHNVKKWPFDSNTCHVNIGSWIYYGFKMVNHPMDTTRITLLGNVEWEVLFMESAIKEEFFECCPEYQALTVRFDLKRRSAYPFTIVCIPAIVIAISVLASFWINPKAPERTCHLLVTLLVDSCYLKYVYDIVPRNGDDVPYIILYYKDSMVMIIIAILWTIISRYVATTTRTSNVPLPNALLTFLESWPSKILCIVSRPGKQLPAIMTEDDGSLIGLQSSVYNDWSWLAHLLDRFIFLLYCITFFIFLVAFI